MHAKQQRYDKFKVKYSLVDKSINECPTDKFINEYVCNEDCNNITTGNTNGNYIEEIKACNSGYSGYYTISVETGKEAKKFFITCP